MQASLSVRGCAQCSVALGVLQPLATKPRDEREGKGGGEKGDADSFSFLLSVCRLLPSLSNVRDSGHGAEKFLSSSN